VTSTVASVLLSLVAPPLCVACREPDISGAGLCPHCRAHLVPLPTPRCDRCGAPVSATAVGSPDCSECRRRSLAFDTAWAPFAYTGIARQAVAALKSRAALAVTRLMAAEIASRTPPAIFSGALVPVPAHPRRRRRHGFNQAATIARSLGAATGLPVSDRLRRRSTPPQVGLERAARLANARGSVSARPGHAGGRFVLVDDVYTTGSTLDACAAALREAGAHEVNAVTFARAMRGR
jgi:ComF family protein